MSKPLKVYVQHRLPLNAITAYRILQPLKILETDKKVEILEDDMDPGMPEWLRTEMLSISDIAFTHAVPATVIPRDYAKMRGVSPRYNPRARIVDYPPLWIMDIDDIYDWVSPTNPAFATWGVRDLSGELVGDGGKIVAELQDGTKEVLFEDGKRIKAHRGFKRGSSYSYRHNMNRIAKLKIAINNVQCVTVTTDELKEHILSGDKPNRIEVFPNCVFRQSFPNIVPPAHRTTRILWQGGGSHYDDWRVVRDAMVEVTKRYPRIKWVVFGQDYTPLMLGGGITWENIEYHPWVDFPAHKYELALKNCSINLAFVDPNHFSKGKSSIKFYEASALKVPMATLATNAPPYNRDILDGVTGMLFDGPEGFINKLSTMIENPKLCRELAQNAHDWVWENRDAEKWAPKYYDLFCELKEQNINRLGNLTELLGATEVEMKANNEPLSEEDDAVPIEQ